MPLFLGIREEGEEISHTSAPCAFTLNVLCVPILLPIPLIRSSLPSKPSLTPVNTAVALVVLALNCVAVVYVVVAFSLSVSQYQQLSKKSFRRVFVLSRSTPLHM